MKNLVLVGFMGSGKTAAGKLAARRLGMKFADSDDLIEQRLGMKISQVFEQKGEPFFREHERAVVQDLAGRQDHVIATGGGVVLNPDNLRDFNATGVVVCCWVDARTAYERTKHTKHRPLLEADADRLTRIESLLKQREPLYRAIPLQVETSSLTVEQQADELVRIYQSQSSSAGV